MKSSNKKIIFWLYSGCILVFAMVVIGGITRLTGSGLSITEWKVITGTLPPLNETDWQLEFAQYQLSPQFQKINSDFNIEDFKQIYFWEYFHRLIGRMIGIVFIIPFLYFYFKKQIDKKLLPKLIIIFLLGAWQGFLGWYMVKSGLQNNPFVSHYRLAIHLVNAFLTFGYIFWVVQDLNYPSPKNKTINKNILLLSITAFVLLIIQITYGAFVAGLHAGHIFNSWPKMGDDWIASSVTSSFESDGITSLFNSMATVQFIHRTLALIVFCLVFGIWLMRKKLSWKLNFQQISSINMTMAIMLIQVLLGIFTLLFNVPVWLGVLHQAGAFMIFAAMIFQIHRIAKS